MFFDINKTLCDVFHGLDPIKLLDYSLDDVIELINQTLMYSKRHTSDSTGSKKVVRKKAGDDWF